MCGMMAFGSSRIILGFISGGVIITYIYENRKFIV